MIPNDLKYYFHCYDNQGFKFHGNKTNIPQKLFDYFYNNHESYNENECTKAIESVIDEGFGNNPYVWMLRIPKNTKTIKIMASTFSQLYMFLILPTIFACALLMGKF